MIPVSYRTVQQISYACTNLVPSPLAAASRPVLAVYRPCAWRLFSESISQSALGPVGGQSNFTHSKGAVIAAIKSIVIDWALKLSLRCAYVRSLERGITFGMLSACNLP